MVRTRSRRFAGAAPALFALGLAALCPGCKRASAPAPAVEAPADPMLAERRQIGEGAYALGVVASDLQDAIAACKRLAATAKDAELRRALTEALDDLDDAGATIADYTAEPPPPEAFRADFSRQDTNRIKAIAAANDALHDVDSAGGTLGDLAGSTDDAGLAQAVGTIQDAGDELASAIKAFGGKVDEDEGAG